MKNVLFYKYVEIEDVNTLQKQLQKLCKQGELLGKILLANEGINGCVTGTEENARKFMEEVSKDPRFYDIDFKITDSEKHGFKKMFVRIRDEIVGAKFDVDLQNKAPYVEPEQLKEWLDSDEDIILVDARNDYESDIGRFENAITPNLKVFREWPSAVEELKELKDKKIVTYCTGGIRCEKASAYMKQAGFSNVFQLHGGILRYGKEVGDKHWKGTCFVFDTRGVVSLGENKPISQCTLCHLPSDTYHNCEIKSCDKLFLACNKCIEILQGCCSKSCRGQLRLAL